jgi:hypothetical protein
MKKMKNELARWIETSGFLTGGPAGDPEADLCAYLSA